MVERYPGDGAAANGFVCRWLRDDEARLLFEAGYPVPPDVRMPDSWRLSQMGLAMPPIPPARTWSRRSTLSTKP